MELLCTCVLLFQQDAEDALKEACSVLGSLKEECDLLLTSFFPQIWEMIVNEVVSDSVHMCVSVCLCYYMTLYVLHVHVCMYLSIPKILNLSVAN